MPLDFADVQTQYDKDKNLKKADVTALLEWVQKQPHLPNLTELQAILFLHSCYYSNEATKITIEHFFTLKTLYSDIFKHKIYASQAMNNMMDVFIATILPRKTPEGHSIIYLKIMDSNVEKFNFTLEFKLIDMVTMLHLHQDGISEGLVILGDFDKCVLGHVTKVSPFVVKKFFDYLQEAIPVRLKAIHYINLVPFMDRVLSLVKPFLKSDLMQMLHLHSNIDSLKKFIPLECIPEDYGGTMESLAIMHEKMKQKIKENYDFFEWEEQLKVDESRRLEKRTNGDLYGTDGTFKKLQID